MTAETEAEPREVFTVGFAARTLGIDRSTLKRWISLEMVPAPQRTKNGWRVWDRPALEQLLRAAHPLLRPASRNAPGRHERLVVHGTRAEELISVTGPGGAER